MRHPLFFSFILLLSCLLSVLLHAAGASATEWQTVYESDLTSGSAFRDGDFGAAAFFGFGSKGNTTNTLRIPGVPEPSGKGSLVTPGRWHNVTALREGGKLTLQVDGRTVVVGDDARGGYPGPYLGLFCKNEVVFRKVEVQRRDDSELRQYLSTDALRREADRGFREWPLRG